MLRPDRKSRQSVFTPAINWPTLLLTGALFGAGLVISAHPGWVAAGVYLVLWGLSYPLIYAGACRYCAYYGKACPIPLEGSGVRFFFKKSDKPFGFSALVWATAAYGLRVAVPLAVVFKDGLVAAGAIYLGVLTAFWVVHLRIVGCPNCVNTACPLNPGE